MFDVKREDYPQSIPETIYYPTYNVNIMREDVGSSRFILRIQEMVSGLALSCNLNEALRPYRYHLNTRLCK